MSNTPLFPKAFIEVLGYKRLFEVPLGQGLNAVINSLPDPLQWWELQDSYDMYGLTPLLKEVETVEHLVEIAEMLKKYGASYAAYLSAVGIEGNEEDFIEHYLGEHPDLESAAIAALLIEYPAIPADVVDLLDAWRVGRWVEKSKKYAIEQLAGSYYLFLL